MKSVIYDFETLSNDPTDAVVVSLAALEFDESRFLTKPYEFLELVESSKMIKFDVEEQIGKYKRKVKRETIEWWRKLDPKTQEILIPSKYDVSIDKIYDFLIVGFEFGKRKKVFTRGNTFDPVILESILKQLNLVNPMNYGAIRDTRSYIDGMTWGYDIQNNFMPPGLENKFIQHDPKHDIAMDVMRMQYVLRTIHT